MNNCFQAGQSEPICQKCFFTEGVVKFQITYQTRKVLVDEIDKIHSDMTGSLGGDLLDLEIEDIAFDDDDHATIIAQVKGSQLEHKNLDFLEEQACRTVEEADQNLHKFIQKFVRFKIIED